MTPATQQWPPWPIEVGKVMASATLELGVQGFEHGEDVSIDGGDYGRGCRVFKLTSKDHPEYPKWCVSIEISDRVVGNEEIAKTYRQKMLDFVRDVVHRPGWYSAMRMATCQEGVSHEMYWMPVCSRDSGSYGGATLSLLVYDSAIAERDKNKEQPVVKDSSWRGALEGVVRHQTTRLDWHGAEIKKLRDAQERCLDLLAKTAAATDACGATASQKVTALAESLSRRLDALEKQAGPIGKLYVTDVEHATGTVSFDTKDPKDALIRDLMTWLSDHHVYPYVIWDDTKNGFRDRAEKLGIKL